MKYVLILLSSATLLLFSNSAATAAEISRGHTERSSSIESSKKLSQNRPEMAKFFLRRALEKMQMDNTTGAMHDFRKAIYLDPKSYDAYFGRAYLKYVKLKDVKGALADNSQAIAINPKFYNAYGARAYLKYAELGDKAGGIADLRKARDLATAQGNTEFANNATTQLKEWSTGR
jgi:Tfp pilus assembly protein PilF